MAPPLLTSVEQALGNSFKITYTVGSGPLSSIVLLVNGLLTDDEVRHFDLSPTSSQVLITGDSKPFVNGELYTFTLRQRNGPVVIYSEPPAERVRAVDVPRQPVIAQVAPIDGGITFVIDTGAQQGGPLRTMTFVAYSTGEPIYATWSFAPDAMNPTNILVRSTANANKYDVAILGLTNEVFYEIVGSTINDIGESIESASVTSTPRNDAMPPKSVTAVPGDMSITLTIDLNAIPWYDTIESFYIRSNPTADPVVVPRGEMRLTLNGLYEYNISGLNNGQTYSPGVALYFTAALLSEYISPGAQIPFKAPNAPANFTALAFDKEVSLKWDNVPTINNGGFAISSYEVLDEEDNTFFKAVSPSTGATTETTVTELVNGSSHRFKVRAVTLNGNTGSTAMQYSSYTVSSPIIIIPFTAPNKPLNLHADVVVGATPADAAMVDLTWDPPADSGGFPVAFYYVYVNGILFVKNESNKFNSTSCRVDTGLTNGNLAEFYVQAVIYEKNITSNPEYLGALSDSVSVTPYALSAAVLNFQAVASDQSVSLSWTVPFTATGGLPLAYFELFRNDAFYKNITDYDVDTSVSNGTTYSYKMRAVVLDPNNQNVPVTGVFTESKSATPFKSATGPQTFTATVVIGQSPNVSLTWVEPAETPGLTFEYYEVYVNDVKVIDTTNLSYSAVTNMTNGSSASFKVRYVGKNAIGDIVPGSFATTSATPFNRAVPPTGLAATVVIGETPTAGPIVNLTWNAVGSPENGGFAVAYYEVYIEKTGYTLLGSVNAPSTSYSAVTNMTNGSLASFKVRSVVLDQNNSNNPEPGDLSTYAESATPFAKPSAPLNLRATPQNGSIDLIWDEPAQNGGMPVTGYNIYEVGNDKSIGFSPTSSYTVSPLVNGTAHSYYVKAVVEDPNKAANDPNKQVEGAKSANSDTKTPTAAPPAVSNFNVRAKPSDGAGMYFSWTALTNADYNQTITGYKITWEGDFTTASRLSNSSFVPMSSFTLGTSYSFNIQAIMTNPNTGVDVYGPVTTPVSKIAFVTPVGVTSLTVIPISDGGSISASWTPPPPIGADIDYQVCIDDGFGIVQMVFITDSKKTFTGLPNGVRQTLYVISRAVDPNGVLNPYTNEVEAYNGKNVNLICYAFKAPSAPLNLTGTARDKGVTLQWDSVPEASNGGFAVYNYKVFMMYGSTETDLGSHFNAGPKQIFATSINLSNGGLYTFRVQAVVKDLNSNGDVFSVKSDPFSIRPYKAAISANVTVESTDQTLTLTYGTPDVTGTGMSLENVQYSVQLNELTAVVTDSNTYTFENLTNDINYSIRVFARTRNPNDSSPSSYVDASHITTSGIPSGDPIIRDVAVNDRQIIVSAIPNGSFLDEYLVIASDGAQDYFFSNKQLNNPEPNALTGLVTLTITPEMFTNFPADQVFNGAVVILSNNNGLSYLKKRNPDIPV